MSKRRNKKSGNQIETVASILNLIAAILGLITTAIGLIEKLIE